MAASNFVIFLPKISSEPENSNPRKVLCVQQIQIASGSVIFSQNLGSVNVVVEPYATVSFTVQQQLNSVTVFPGSQLSFVTTSSDGDSPDAQNGGGQEQNGNIFEQIGQFLNNLGKAIVGANDTLRDNHLPYVDIEIVPDPDNPNRFIIRIINWVHPTKA